MMKIILKIFGSLALLAVLLTLGVRCGVLFFSHNYNVAAEANGLYGILEVADSKPLYPPLTQKPYGVYLYGPLHAYFNGWLLKLAHIHKLRAQVLVVRLASLIALILAVVVFYRGVIRPGKISPVLFSFALILIGSKFCDYATSARNDTFSILFEILAIVAFLNWIRTRVINWLVFFVVAACLSFWTRQTGGVAMASAFFYLLWQSEFRLSAKVAGIFIFINLVFFAAIYAMSGGALTDHLILANIRGFRPVNWGFFDFSLLSFIVSYLFFIPLVIYGISEERSNQNKFLLIAIAVSLFVAGSCFLRAGGDVNYFFLTLFLGSYYVALGLRRLFQSNRWPATVGKIALIGQLLLVAFICAEKSISGYQIGRLPYEAEAQRVLREIPPFGYVTGYYAQILGIYLRGWAVHGPDVSGGSVVAANGHPKFRFLLEDLEHQISEGKINAVIIATPNCDSKVYGIGHWAKWYKPAEVWTSWLCVYKSKNLSSKHLS